jgi:NADP-dependent 3-hydroxy acid dehydrogenase YdfG
MAELEKELSELTKRYILYYLMCVIKAVSESIASLPIAFFTIDILINNAGNAHGLDPIQTGDLDDWDAMIDINVKACCMFRKPSFPNDRKKIRSYHQYWFHCRKRSVSKRKCCATKHAVDALNQGMRMDLNPFGIRGRHPSRNGAN